MSQITYYIGRISHFLRRHGADLRLVVVAAPLIAGLSWLLGMLCYGATVGFSHHLQQIPPVAAFLLPPLGMALCVWLTRRYFPYINGSGIPQVYAALQASDSAQIRLLDLRAALAKLALVALGTYSGASIGRMGPMVQIGSTVAGSVAERTGASPELRRLAILAGGAAGMASTFNTPLAGVAFALEVLGGRIGKKLLLCLMLVLGATCVIVAGLPRHPGNLIPNYQLVLPLDQWWVVALLGIASGLLAGLTVKLLALGACSLPGWTGNLARHRPVAFAALCGFLVALINLGAGGGIHGTGYLEVEKAMVGDLPDGWYGMLKWASTMLCLLSGMPGGILMPALAIGTGLGTDFGRLLGDLHLAAAVLAMAAFLAGTVRAPLTATFLSIELSQEPLLFAPALACALLASFVARQIHDIPLFVAQAQPLLADRTGAPDSPTGKAS